MVRRRIRYAVFLVTVIAVGLASRSRAARSFVSTDVGDALWAVAVYALLRVLAPGVRVWRAAVAAVVIAFAVELSQLYHAPWIDAVRRNRLGGLLLGFGFVPTDLLCYAAGIAVAAVVDAFFLSGHGRRRHRRDQAN